MRKTKIAVFVLLASLLIALLAFAAQKVNVLFTSTPAKQNKLLKLTGSPCHTCEGRYPVVWWVSGFPFS